MKLIILLLLLSSQAFSFGSDWVYMTKSGESRIDWQYSKCFYSNSSGSLAISIIIKNDILGSCPHSIEYNPMSGVWK